MDLIRISCDRIQNLKSQYYLLDEAVSDEEEFRSEDSNEESEEDESSHRSAKK